MAVQGYVCFVSAVFMLFLCSFCHGYKFYVGGRDGWMSNPSESYSHWAGRNRFQVNDTLLFKMNKGEVDTVLQVTKDNYNECNVKNPIKTITTTEEYEFTRSGPHYFISSNVDNCNKGLKIIIVVLAVRPKKPPLTPSAPVDSPPPASPAPSAPVSPSQNSSPTPSPMENQQKNSGAVFGSSLLGVVLCTFGVML